MSLPEIFGPNAAPEDTAAHCSSLQLTAAQKEVLDVATAILVAATANLAEWVDRQHGERIEWGNYVGDEEYDFPPEDEEEDEEDMYSLDAACEEEDEEGIILIDSVEFPPEDEDEDEEYEHGLGGYALNTLKALNSEGANHIEAGEKQQVLEAVDEAVRW